MKRRKGERAKGGPGSWKVLTDGEEYFNIGTRSGGCLDYYGRSQSRGLLAGFQGPAQERAAPRGAEITARPGICRRFAGHCPYRRAAVGGGLALGRVFG